MTRTARQKRLRRERRERLQHCPSGKRAFTSQYAADFYMTTVTAPLKRSYKCHMCSDWHLTSQTKKQYKKLAKTSKK